MNYEEKGLKEWKVIILIRMYKDSNFFFSIAGFFRFPLLFLSFSRSLSLSLSFSPSFSRSFARSSFPTRTRRRKQSFFLSSHPSIFIIHLQTNALSYPPPPLFLSMHLFLSFTRSHDRGQEVEVRELRSLDYCCASSLPNLYQWRNKIGLE